MKKFAALTTAAIVAVGALGTPKAEARGGGAVAAGVIGGLAAGALLGAAISDAHAAPAYGYGYSRPAPVYGYEDEAPPVVRYRPAPGGREYVEEVPVYRRPRPVRVYEDGDSGYRRVGYGFRRDCDRPRGYGGW